MIDVAKMTEVMSKQSMQIDALIKRLDEKITLVEGKKEKAKPKLSIVQNPEKS